MEPLNQRLFEQLCAVPLIDPHTHGHEERRLSHGEHTFLELMNRNRPNVQIHDPVALGSHRPG